MASLLLTVLKSDSNFKTNYLIKILENLLNIYSTINFFPWLNPSS